MGDDRLPLPSPERTAGSAARSKHSLTRRRSALASSIDLKKWQYSCTPLMPNVLLTEPTPTMSVS